MEDNCCQTNNKKGLFNGLIYGLFPHAFCIGFIVFSVIGISTATAFFKKFLLIPHFFSFLVGISFLLATLSAVIYLRKNRCLCVAGIKNKWKYLTILYGVTILTNLLMFSVVFPALANINSQNTISQNNLLSSLSIEVQIPCSGHAPLIIDEIKKDDGVGSVWFKAPNIFEVKYNPEKTSPERIASLEIFKTFKIIVQ